MESVESRLVRYARIDSQSDPESSSFPSTKEQLRLLEMLKEEMIGMGMTEVTMDKYGYVMGTIPSTCCTSDNITDQTPPTIGFIAHVDTSYEVCGRNVQPQIRDGVITSDGTTLLGADDKAGVAEIMTAAEHLLHNPHIRHGKIRLAFTPDEEIGKGMDHFDAKAFGAAFAYTVDGGALGSLEYESFNAAEATITIHGENTHPGYAKGKMVNSQRIAMQIDAMLPEGERPEQTSDRDGFFHMTKIDGSVSQTVIHYIIRDHDRETFENRKRKLTDIIAAINAEHGKNIAELVVRDQYYNMREQIEPHMEIVEIALRAMAEAGVKPQVSPIRGGTDGSHLSFMGVPCPNIFCGAEQIHSTKEFVRVDVMYKAVDVIVNICRLFCDKVLEK